MGCLAGAKEGSEETERTEGMALILLLAMTFCLRIVYIFHYRVSSDEPQHLHVVWGWAQGLLPYRDLFDNHTPLFHLLCTPIFILVGERPDVLYAMRLAMIPIYAISLWSIYSIGRTVFSERVGLWAAIFTGLFPRFFFCSLEFRTDDLWVALWLFALAVLLRGNRTPARSFLVGTILGVAVGVSLKSILFLGSLGVASWATLALLARNHLPRPTLQQLLLSAGSGLIGLSLVPIALTLFFAFKGALGPFFYGTVTHNMVGGIGNWHESRLQFLVFPLVLPLLWWSGRVIFRHAPCARVGTRRVFILFAAGAYISLLASYWPLPERQHYLPFFPLLILLCTPFVLTVSSWIPISGNIRPLQLHLKLLVPVLVAFLEIGLLMTAQAPWNNRTRAEINLLTEVLRLTRRSDPVIDTKGEMIFRQRSYYYVLEKVTRSRIKRKMIIDDIPEQLIATRTCVAALDSGRFPPRARRFLQENYLRVGRLRVVGQFLDPPRTAEMHPVSFEVRIPAQYALVAERGTVKGSLDGASYVGPRFLALGHHEFRPSCQAATLALVWAQAVERGFLPFPQRS